MASIREQAEEFKDYYNLSQSERGIVDRWISLLGESGIPDAKYSDMSDEERGDFKDFNRLFVRSYFDERPDVVKLLTWLLSELGIDTEDWFKFENTFSGDEICVMLLRYLQGEPDRGSLTQEDIGKHFGTTDRTIGEYLRKMRPNAMDLNRCRILGQAVEMNTSRGSNVPESTTHPIFLALDLVELHTLVSILQDHMEGGVESIVVLSILDKIRGQVTDYASKRLPEPPERHWMERQRIYEKDRVPGRALIFNEKEHLRARVTYEEPDVEGAQTFEGFIFRDHKNRYMVNVQDDSGETRTIDNRRIIKLENI